MIAYLLHKKVMALELMAEESSKHIKQAFASTINYTATRISYIFVELNSSSRDKKGYSFSN